MSVKVLIGIQARSNSQRLPGKIYELIGAKEMLRWVYDAASRVTPMNKAVETFSVVLGPEGDERLERFCKTHHIPFFGGHPTDLVTRYIQGQTYYHADMVIRVTGDCPMIQHEIVERTIRELMEVDYASNTILRTWPNGYDCQGVSKEALRWFDENQTGEREHLFKIFDENQRERDKFMKAGFTFRHVLSAKSPVLFNLSVDTKQDLENVRRYIYRDG